MRLWKKTTVRWRLDGRIVPSGTPHAQRESITAKRFYGTLRLANGKQKQQPLTEDRDSSEKLLRRLQTDEDRKRAVGAPQHVGESSRPIQQQADAYISFLQSRSSTSDYVVKERQRLAKLLDAMRTKTLAADVHDRALRGAQLLEDVQPHVL